MQPPFPFRGSFSDMQGTVALRVSSHPAPHPPQASKAASKASSTHRTWLPPPPSPHPWRVRPPRALGLCPQARVAGPGMAQALEMVFWKMNEGVLLLPQSGAGPDHGAHLAPRTPPDATRAKIHTNIYSVPASGWGWGGGLRALGGAAGLYRQPLGKVGLWQEDRVQRLMGPGGVQKARPWEGGRGAGLVPRGHGVQVGLERSVPTHPAQARVDSRSWWLPRGQHVSSWPSNLSPCPTPNREGSTRILLLRVGKTTVQVVRFKLQIIKITIQNKKTPVSNTPTKSLPGRRRGRRPGC